MAPTRKARSLYKQSYTNEVSPIRHGDGADRRTQRKRKLSDMLGPQWSKDELKRFYEAYRKHGKDWKKVGAVIRNRSIEMVEALYMMNRAYLSLPEGTASLAGLIAMMSDHYNNQSQSDYEQESDDGAGTSRKPEKRSPGKVQPKIYKGSDDRLTSHSLEVSSSYGYQPLMKKKRSGGNRPRVVGKRTPRFPVSYSSDNVNGESHLSPSRQGLKFKFDGKDDKVSHGRLIALAEASQRGGSPQLSRTPKTVVRSSDMDEDALEGKMQPDGGDISRDVHYFMQTRSTGALSPKGRRFYRKNSGVDSSKNKQLSNIKEACGGNGQIMGVDSGKSYSEIIDAVIGTSSYGSRKRSKQVLFKRDEDSAFDALQTLADLSLRMPESTNDDDSFVQINEDSSDTGKPKSVEAMPEHQQKEKRRVLGFEIEEHHLSSRSKRVIDKSSQPRKASVGIVSPGTEAVQETNESKITKMSRKRQKLMTFKVSKQTDAHINESYEAEAADVGKSPSKDKRSSKGASPMLVKHSENSSLYADARKEGGNSAVFTVDVPIADQVEKITKIRSRRKMKLQKPQILADSNLLDKTKKLSNCFSNNQARRWCAFEWFYSAIDYPWFAKREFVEYLFHVGLGHVPKLTRVEWGVIRSSLGKPRRYSEQFLKEEKEKLNQYRDSVRKHYTELRSGTREGLPTDLAKPLSVGQRVTAIHPKTREIHDGSVLTVDHNRCRVQFDLPELGVEFVMDIDCMPLNPLENIPTSLARHAAAVDKFLESFSKLKVNGQEIDRQEGYLKFAPGGILDNMDIESLMKRANYVVHNLSKQEKVAFTTADSHSNIGPQEIATSQQVACSQPLSQELSQAIEADVQAIAELTRVLDRKQVLVSGLREMNNDVENQKDGDVSLKDSELFKKQYAAVLIQLREVDERVSSALYCLRQRNTYKGNLSLTWPRSVTDTVDSVGVMSSLNNSEIHIEESPESHVNEIVESSRTTARMMVDSAIKAYSSMVGAENTFEKIEETIDYVSDQLVQPPLEDSYIPAGRFSNAAEHGSLACQEKSKGRTVIPLQADVPSPKLGNPSPVPSELVAKCVATLLMIQKCTERQFPPADVAQILNSAVASLQPCSSQNLPVYADIERCMVMIRNQIMALIPT